uniref:Tyrosinase copper-binding domain-containing protein n=1 Tax=Ciona savignyi TaxID=51511 RepID=H2ZNM8_CIOSA
MPSYTNFDLSETLSHNQIHNCMCMPSTKLNISSEDCTFSLVVTDFSSFDPLFFLHHSQVDRIYALYKHSRELLGQQDWSKQSFLEDYDKEYPAFNFKKRQDIAESFHWPLSPFCNASMNPSYVTLNEGSWTVENSFYYQELYGYKYDTFDLGGRPWLPLLEDLEEMYSSPYYGSPTPFISHVAPDIGEVSYRKICRLNTRKCYMNNH